MTRFASLCTLLAVSFVASPGAAGQEAACIDGFADSFPCASVDLLGHLTLGQMNGNYANDIWGWTDNLSGKEYALVGLADGTAFVDLSDPTEPGLSRQAPDPFEPFDVA